MKTGILLSLLLFIGALGSGCCFTAATAESPKAPPAPAPVVQAPPPAPAPVVQKCECDLSQLNAAVKKAEMAADRAALAADRAEAAANKAEAVFMKKMKK